ncbi:MAG: DNA primase, partial [Nevskiales bacterium]|nr:DNA primase [Nevskiales bacterium]
MRIDDMAGRIPQSFIQDLLARTDIVQVIGERLQLKKAGKEYTALSPFTNEKTPSFTVSPQKQFYHCFSSGKHGTAITFLMEYERLSFVEAVEDLARRAGLQVPREGGAAMPAPVLDGPLEALVTAERFYKAQLKQYPVAIDYLKKRGVSGETARRFGIGYAPDAWDALARQFPNPKHALEAGLLIRKEDGDSCYDRFRNRIMFPIRDTRGRVIGFGGRTLGDDKAKYLNSPETLLFHKGRNLYGLYEARQGTGSIPHLLVVEGYMDTVMLAQHGILHVVATLGTATTREHLALLFKSTDRVVFCFDGDRAGRAAAWRALEQVLPEIHEGRECRFMFLPEGQDPDTLVQQVGAD